MENTIIVSLVSFTVMWNIRAKNGNIKLNRLRMGVRWPEKMEIHVQIALVFVISFFFVKNPKFFSSKWKINAIVWQINWINSCSLLTIINKYKRSVKKKQRCDCECGLAAMQYGVYYVKIKIDCHHEIWWKSMRLLGRTSKHTHTVSTTWRNR